MQVRQDDLIAASVAHERSKFKLQLAYFVSQDFYLPFLQRDGAPAKRGGQPETSDDLRVLLQELRMLLKIECNCIGIRL